MFRYAWNGSLISCVDSVQWAAKHEVPLAKLFSKTLITKFAWAMTVPEDFEW